MNRYLDSSIFSTDYASTHPKLIQELMQWFLLSLIVLSAVVHCAIWLLFPNVLTFSQQVYCFAPIYTTLLLSSVFLRFRLRSVSIHVFLMGMVLSQFLIILFVTGHMTYVYVSYTNVVLVAGLMIGPLSGVSYTCLIVFCVIAYPSVHALQIVPPIGSIVSEGHILNIFATIACFIFTGVTVSMFVIKRSQLHHSLIKEKERTNHALSELELLQEQNELRFELGVLTGWLGRQLTSIRYAQEFITSSLFKIHDVLELEHLFVVIIDKNQTDLFVYDPKNKTVSISNFDHHNMKATWTDLQNKTRDFLAEKVPEKTIGEDKKMFFQEILGTDGAVGSIIAFAPDISREKEIFFGTVANMFSSAFSREQAEEQLRHLQKMKALNLLAGGIAHDFNNLLMSIMTNNDIALSLVEKDSELTEFLQRISWATDQGCSLTRKLLSFNKKELFSPEVIDITDTIREMTPILKQICTNKSALDIQYPSQEIFVYVDKKDFESAILNLFINARDAIENSGDINVRISPNNSQENPSVDVIIQDTGSGIPSSMFESIFEPFVSTKSNGTGLGLTMVRAMVERGKGDIFVDSSSKGTKFTLSFPICSSEDFKRQYEMRKQFSTAKGSPISILVLDDDRLVLLSVARILKESDFHVYQAESVAQAKDVLLHHNVELVLSDINMPGESGIEFYKHCEQHHPEISVILMTGFLVQEDFPDTLIIEKPISAQDIIFQINKELKREHTIKV